MEKFPSRENVPTPEDFPLKEEVLEKLKTGGLTPENLTIVARWYEFTEKMIDTERDKILFELDKMDFYLAINDMEGAFDIAKDALQIAVGEKQEDLIEKIIEVFPELDRNFNEDSI